LKDLRAASEEIPKLRPLIGSPNRTVRVLLPAKHGSGDIAPMTGKGAHGFTGMSALAAADVVGRQVAADGPPSDPAGRLLGLDCPQSDVRIDVEGRILANAEMICSLPL
jgi:hypothetical protein